MAEKQEAPQEETPQPTKKKGSKTLIIIIAAATLVLSIGGFVGFKLLSGKHEGGEKEEPKVEAKTSILALDPFVLNLADHGRYLKITIQFEISDEALHETIAAKTPQLRDTIITLVSSKSLNSISSPEGKFQLKDEVLFRANQVMGMGKDVFKNLYFTEFVMQ